MTEIERQARFTCDEAREAIQERLDDSVSASTGAALDGHLAYCSPCREYEDGLLKVRETLRSLPVVTLPDEVLETVRAQTTRPGQPRAAGYRWLIGWRAAAAAAVLAFALLAGRMAMFRPSGEPSLEMAAAPDDAQLLADAQLVLELTGRALLHIERTTVQEVLTERVAPALNSVPIRFP